jgi:hypothetical protein
VESLDLAVVGQEVEGIPVIEAEATLGFKVLVVTKGRSVAAAWGGRGPWAIGGTSHRNCRSRRSDVLVCSWTVLRVEMERKRKDAGLDA